MGRYFCNCFYMGLLVVASPLTWAAETLATAQGISGGQIITLVAGLVFVLALVFSCGWLVRRFSGMPSSRTGAIKIISVLPMGSRERLVLVEVGGQQLLLGVSAQQINTLHTFNEPVVDAAGFKKNTEFAQKLHQMLSRR